MEAKIKDYALRIDMIDDPYIRLANAVILNAVDDYLHPERISTDPKYRYSDRCKAYVRGEVEKFIKSDWFLLLTDIDPDVFLEKLKRSV